MLVDVHHNTSQLKVNEIESLTQQYENFYITCDETIEDGFMRFKSITNRLNSLDSKRVDKAYFKWFNNVLPTYWESKEAKVNEARSLGESSLKKIIEDLNSYEEFLDNVKVITKEVTNSFDPKEEIIEEEEAVASTRNGEKYNEHDACFNQEMGIVGITLENKDRPHEEVTQLTRIEALEVLP